MNKFIAYFDFLGFKDFILNNDIEYQNQIMNDIFRDIESSLGNGKLIKSQKGLISYISESRKNCINFSDTIIFWTNDNTIESLKEITEVAYKFNWKAINFFFPIRGALVFGEIIHADYRHYNDSGGKYNINSVFGRGIVEAHFKAESQDWAGSVIDQSVINFLIENNLEPTSYLSDYAKQYKIPYKPGITVKNYEFAFRLIKGTINELANKNLRNRIERNFANHKKDISEPSVKIKLENTLEYLKSFLA